MRRPHFRKDLPYIAVKPFCYNGGKLIIDAGEGVPSTLRAMTLRRLMRRNRIGPKGHQWTKDMLDKYAQSIQPKPEPVTEPEPELEEVPGWPVSTGYTKEQWETLTEDEKAVALMSVKHVESVVLGGAGWFTITVGGVEEKVQGKVNAVAFLLQNGVAETEIEKWL